MDPQVINASYTQEEQQPLYTLPLNITEPTKRLYIMVQRKCVMGATNDGGRYRKTSKWLPMASFVDKSRRQIVTSIKDAEQWDKTMFEHDKFSFVPIRDVSLQSAGQVIFSSQKNDPTCRIEQMSGYAGSATGGLGSDATNSSAALFNKNHGVSGMHVDVLLHCFSLKE